MNGASLMRCEFEIAPVLTNLSGEIKATVFEKGGVNPVTTISTAQDWYVEVEWSIEGNLVRHLCGDWRVAIALESIGPGEEYQFPRPAKLVPMEPCGDGKYKTTIDVKAGDVAADEDGTTYILSVNVGTKDPCGDAGHISAWCSDLYLNFYPGGPHEPVT